MTGERSQPGETAASGAQDAVSSEAAVVRRTSAGWSVGDEDVPDLTSAMVLADLIAAELPDSAPAPSSRSTAAGGIGAGTAGAGTAGAGTAGGDKVAVGVAGAGVTDGVGGAVGAETVGAVGVSTADAGLAGGAGDGAAGDGTAGGGTADDDGIQDEARRLRVTVSQLERALAVRIRVEQAIGVLAERHRVRPRQAFEQLRSAARGRGQRVIDIAGDVIASATNPLLPLPEELSRPSMAQRQRPRSQRRSRDGQ
jgi:hypothetical protein